MSPISIAAVGSLLADSNVFAYLCACSTDGTFGWAGSRLRAREIGEAFSPLLSWEKEKRKAIFNFLGRLTPCLPSS